MSGARCRSATRNKYEVDAETGHIVLERRLFT